MGSVKFRLAEKSDQAAIRSLIRQTRINPMGLKWQRFLIAVDEMNVLIGCGQVKSHRDGSKELASIAVKEPWRRQGIARAIIEELHEHHCCPIWLTCLSELRPFYAACGFVEMTNLDSMPPYFRRIKRFGRIFRTLTRQENSLAVMVTKEFVIHN